MSHEIYMYRQLIKLIIKVSNVLEIAFFIFFFFILFGFPLLHYIFLQFPKYQTNEISDCHLISITYNWSELLSSLFPLLFYVSGWQNWLELPPGNHEVMSSNPTVSNRTFCNFFILALSFPFLFPCLPKGIFPFPSNLRQPQLSSYGKCREKPGIMKSGLDAKPLFLQDRLLNYIGV